LEGAPADVQKKLAANPKTKIPQILFTVYQHVFNSIYILASILNTPYPPPDLLHPMAEKIQILPSTPKPTPEPEKTTTPEQPVATEKPPTQTAASTQTATGTQPPASGQPSTSQTPGQTATAGGGAQTNTTQP
jgi:hypothetical protein